MKKAGAKSKSTKRKSPKISQSQRFIETAKKLEADESGEKFEQALSRTLKPIKEKPRS